eukprot:g80453.t1
MNLRVLPLSVTSPNVVRYTERPGPCSGPSLPRQFTLLKTVCFLSLFAPVFTYYARIAVRLPTKQQQDTGDWNASYA